MVGSDMDVRAADQRDRRSHGRQRQDVIAADQRRYNPILLDARSRSMGLTIITCGIIVKYSGSQLR